MLSLNGKRGMKFWLIVLRMEKKRLIRLVVLNGMDAKAK